MFERCVQLLNLFLYISLFPQIERDAKIGKLDSELAQLQKVEMLSALEKLGEKLNATEEQFLQTYSSESLKKFEQVSGEIGKFVTIMLQRGLVITMSVTAYYDIKSVS